jgi:hypothetical protein
MMRSILVEFAKDIGQQRSKWHAVRVIRLPGSPAVLAAVHSHAAYVRHAVGQSCRC